jgi:hypothetical protein
MKRFTTLMLGTALAAALSLAAQTPTTPSAPASPSTTKVKKHKKHVKKNTAAPATSDAPASSTPSAPAKK